MSEQTRTDVAGRFQHDIDQGCVYVDDGFVEVTGRAPDEAMGEGWRDTIHPDDLAIIDETQGSLEGEGVVVRVVRPCGEVRLTSTTYSTLVDDDGTIVSILGTVTDITDAGPELLVDAYARIRHLEAELAVAGDRLAAIAALSRSD